LSNNNVTIKLGSETWYIPEFSRAPTSAKNKKSRAPTKAQFSDQTEPRIKNGLLWPSTQNWFGKNYRSHCCK